MARMIQIRNVPDRLHRQLKARAALAGKSLSEFLLHEIRFLADRPTMEELVQRLEERRPVNPRESPVDAVRAVRAERDAR